MGGRFTGLLVAARLRIDHRAASVLFHRLAERLRAAGKPPKVVIVGAMRQLLTFLNAMLRERLGWSQLEIVQNLH